MPQDEVTEADPAGRDGVDNPSRPCPGPCDVAIPAVYPNQPIMMPGAEVRSQIPFDLDVRASLEATFSKPGTSPPLSIARWNGGNAYVLGLGHAGIAMINGVTGAVRYYEYGRYDDANYGQVRDVPSVSGVAIAFDPESRDPTQGSLGQFASALTRTNRGPYGFEAVYVKLANGAFDTTVAFAEERRRAVNARRADAYDVASNHCFTFAMDVARAAGVRTQSARSAPRSTSNWSAATFSREPWSVLLLPTSRCPRGRCGRFSEAISLSMRLPVAQWRAGSAIRRG